MTKRLCAGDSPYCDDGCIRCDGSCSPPNHSHPPVHLGQGLLAKALAAEIHIDEEHGFPAWMTPEHLATLVIEQYHRLAHEDNM